MRSRPQGGFDWLPLRLTIRSSEIDATKGFFVNAASSPGSGSTSSDWNAVSVRTSASIPAFCRSAARRSADCPRFSRKMKRPVPPGTAVGSSARASDGGTAPTDSFLTKDVPFSVSNSPPHGSDCSNGTTTCEGADEDSPAAVAGTALACRGTRMTAMPMAQMTRARRPLTGCRLGTNVQCRDPIAPDCGVQTLVHLLNAVTTPRIAPKAASESTCHRTVQFGDARAGRQGSTRWRVRLDRPRCCSEPADRRCRCERDLGSQDLIRHP